MNLQALSLTSVECPKCSKHSIVSTADGTYECLNCDFRKSLKSQSDQPKSSDNAEPRNGDNALPAAVGVFGLLLMLLLFA